MAVRIHRKHHSNHLKFIVELTSALLILLFIYAALNKLLDVEKFRVQMGKSPILNVFVGMLWWLVPALEILVSLSLLWKKTQLSGLYASFFLMVVFTTYIVFILNFSSYIPCSCGGILEHMTWSQHLVFNILFTIISAAAVLLYPADPRAFLRNKRGDAENLEE